MDIYPPFGNSVFLIQLFRHKRNHSENWHNSSTEQ